MMKIGIHNQPSGDSIGGTEQCVAVLAEALQYEHQVEIVHHRPTLTATHLAQFCGVDLSNVTLRCLGGEPFPPRSWNFVKHYRQTVQSNKALSAPYDIFISFTHEVPPFCHAPKGVLAVLFPYHDEAARVRRGGGIMRSLERAYSRRLWHERFATYQQKTAISEYSRLWTERYWQVECAVLPPPVDTAFERGERKEKQILSVGRFDMRSHPKKQREMANTFADLSTHPELAGWEYYCLGGLGQKPEDHQYFTQVQEVLGASPAHVLADVSRAELKVRYEQASIFWHAAGLDEDVSLTPWQAEHFGITTVEAMAAGCVPLVINKGGQPEIVQHGVSGFVWETLHELKEYTRLLASDAAQCAAMSEAARKRADYYSREQFIKRFRNVLFNTLL